MRYHSTRSQEQWVSGAEAVLRGLAPDGGLYVPETMPPFSWQVLLGLSAQEQATAILDAFLGDIPNMRELVSRAYTGKFQTEDLTPTVKVGDTYVLELFRGPTSAFKDVALSMLPQLLTAAREKLGLRRDIRILTATSGDTGKAALEGFRDVPGLEICVFYPQGGVSAVQRAQMVTQQGNNVRVWGVEGNFDDAQSGVKALFACAQELPFLVSSANSINIGRLVPQITYYFRCYADLVRSGAVQVGQEVNFSVPTGNFGDILAGYLAKALGLPVGRLLCASNANRVLTEFFQTGLYDRRRTLQKTESPSMDILVSSNLERLLFFASRDGALVARLMDRLSEEGCYALPRELLEKLQRDFAALWCDDAQGQAAIGQVYREHHYLMDTHTAVGWAAAQAYRRETGDNRPMVVLSTASPFKFPEAILNALGCAPQGDGFAQLEQLSRVTGLPIPKGLAGLAALPELHTGVIPKEAMAEVALGIH